MAEQEQPNLPDVHGLKLSVLHGLDLKDDWEKRIVLKKKEGRWSVKIDTRTVVLTPRDIRTLQRALVVARRKMDMIYRRTQRMNKRKEMTHAS